MVMGLSSIDARFLYSTGARRRTPWCHGGSVAAWASCIVCDCCLRSRLGSGSHARPMGPATLSPLASIVQIPRDPRAPPPCASVAARQRRGRGYPAQAGGRSRAAAGTCRIAQLAQLGRANWPPNVPGAGRAACLPLFPTPGTGTMARTRGCWVLRLAHTVTAARFVCRVKTSSYEGPRAGLTPRGHLSSVHQRWCGLAVGGLCLGFASG